MLYSIKQRLLSLSDDFDIRDEKGDKAYFVHGHIFSFLESLTLYDMARREAARIVQRVFALTPTYTIRRGGMPSATVRKKLFTLRPQFTITSGRDTYSISGNLLHYEYRFMREGSEVGRVSRKLLSITDSYTVEVIDCKDPLLILSAAIIIDMVLHNPKKERRV